MSPGWMLGVPFVRCRSLGHVLDAVGDNIGSVLLLLGVFHESCAPGLVTHLFTCLPVSIINALPVPMSYQVYFELFWVLFGSLFPPLFFVRFLEVPGGPFWPQLLHLVLIWEPFW